MVIGEDRAEQYPTLVAQNKVLENEVALNRTEMASLHQNLEHVREQSQAELDIYKAELRSEFHSELSAMASNASSNTAIVQYQATNLRTELQSEATHEIQTMKQRCDREVDEARAFFLSRHNSDLQEMVQIEDKAALQVEAMRQHATDMEADVWSYSHANGELEIALRNAETRTSRETQEFAQLQTDLSRTCIQLIQE